jgi:hypothetical protein
MARRTKGGKNKRIKKGGKKAIRPRGKYLVKLKEGEEKEQEKERGKMGGVGNKRKTEKKG